MVEALRELNIEKIALNAVYHWPAWWQGTANFLREAGFDVVWAGNFVDQGFSNPDSVPILTITRYHCPHQEIVQCP